MRWQEKPRPKEFDTRTVILFAFFPSVCPKTRIGYWFEWVIETQTYWHCEWTTTTVKPFKE